jgi:hypothetical protein
MRDPVEIAEIKAADPRRRALVAVLDAWWAAHADTEIKANDLGFEVIEHIDPKASRKSDGKPQFSRQQVARFLDRNANARIGGYVLEQNKDTTKTRPIAYHTLRRDNSGEAAT